MIDAIDLLIQKIRWIDSYTNMERRWHLRCDEIRKRERQRNYTAIKSEVQSCIKKIGISLPEHRLVLEEEPGYFTVRNSNPSCSQGRWTVKVSISEDGAVVDVKGDGSENMTDYRVLRVKVRGDDIYYVQGDRPMDRDEVASMILEMVL